MRYLVACLGFCFVHFASAETTTELAYKLKGSVAKVHVTTKTGGHGVGTGVVVGKDLVATNCHILANATGVNITKFGDSYAPVGLRADWKHDLCILRFQYLQLNPVELGESENLKYEQEIFAIGFPGGPPKPQTTQGKIKALYPFEDAHIIRTDASFVMGASGSPVFDATGKLIALNTFKSPGRAAYFYNIPVKWVKSLLNQPESSELTSMQPDKTPFWDVPEASRPYFMRVVLPYQNEEWANLKIIAQDWLRHEPESPEALFYLGVAEEHLGDANHAKQHLQQAVQKQPTHSASIIELGLMANKSGNLADVEKARAALKSINNDLDDVFNEAISLQANNP